MSQSDGIEHMGLTLCLVSIVADAGKSEESSDVKIVPYWSEMTQVTNENCTHQDIQLHFKQKYVHDFVMLGYVVVIWYILYHMVTANTLKEMGNIQLVSNNKKVRNVCISYGATFTDMD